ncbi:hypothetical protein [Planctomicrobium sp. SH527]|uniref:hypothetical protein n=1 Tax=Planctomicrobium sp. SH527 TaxID=3448123 RepID=UPI003F5BC484
MTKYSPTIDIHSTPGCRLWIDGVGCWLLWFRKSLTFGSVGANSVDYRVRFPANLRTRHLIWAREEDHDWLTPWGECRVNQQQISNRTGVNTGDIVHLGNALKLEWCRPSPLCASVRLSLSPLRSIDSLDGIILFDQICLIGPGKNQHIECPQWESDWILFSQDGKLCGKNSETDEVVRISPKQPYYAGDWRFLLEPIPESEQELSDLE